MTIFISHRVGLVGECTRDMCECAPSCHRPRSHVHPGKELGFSAPDKKSSALHATFSALVTDSKSSVHGDSRGNSVHDLTSAPG